MTKKKEIYGTLISGAGTDNEEKHNIIGLIVLELKDRDIMLSEVDNESYVISIKQKDKEVRSDQQIWLSKISLHAVLTVIMSLLEASDIDSKESIQILLDNGLENISLTPNYKPIKVEKSS